MNAIHQEDGNWYFWDETQADRYGPYESEEIARQKLDEYCREVLGFDPKEPQPSGAGT